MNERRRRWSAWGSVATAALAVVALGVTLYLVRRAFSDATVLISQAEGDALMSQVVTELVEDGDPLAPGLLDRVLHAHAEQGLRYVAIVDKASAKGYMSLEPGTRIEAPVFVAEAGHPELAGMLAPGPISMNGPVVASRAGPPLVGRGRVRVTGVLFASARVLSKLAGTPNAPVPIFAPDGKVDVAEAKLQATARLLEARAQALEARARALDTLADAGAHRTPATAASAALGVARLNVARAWLTSPVVLEFEPPVSGRLRSGLDRITLVAGVAAATLLAFAIALSRSAGRLAALEQRAAREQRLVAIGSMSSVMAHELRNPLASLKGHAQLLAEDAGDEPRRKKAERIVGEAERLEALITSLLDFVRDGPIERVPIAPTELVEQALRDLSRDRVDVDLAAAPGALAVDGGRIARCVHNLIDNALQASGPGDRVSLRVAAAGDDVLIEVTDHGPGLPGGGVAIFEPFVTTRVRGTGLGLPVARRIAEQHGGTLEAHGHPHGQPGAVFRLALPAAAYHQRA